MLSIIYHILTLLSILYHILTMLSIIYHILTLLSILYHILTLLSILYNILTLLSILYYILTLLSILYHILTLLSINMSLDSINKAILCRSEELFLSHQPENLFHCSSTEFTMLLLSLKKEIKKNHYTTDNKSLVIQYALILGYKLCSLLKTLQ